MIRCKLTPIAVMVLLAACATGAPPRAEVGAAGTAIEAAERSGAAERAPAELNSARMKYQSANAAIREAEYDRAARLARESEIDAQLATAKAEAEAAREAREEGTAVESEPPPQSEASPAPPVRGVARSKPIPLTAPTAH
jgi:hypothetical protein